MYPPLAVVGWGGLDVPCKQRVRQPSAGKRLHSCREEYHPEYIRFGFMMCLDFFFIFQNKLFPLSTNLVWWALFCFIIRIRRNKITQIHRIGTSDIHILKKWAFFFFFLKPRHNFNKQQRRTADQLRFPVAAQSRWAASIFHSASECFAFPWQPQNNAPTYSTGPGGLIMGLFKTVTAWRGCAAQR